MLLQMKTSLPLLYFSIDKALTSWSHMPYVVWKGYHLLIAYIWFLVKVLTDKMQSQSVYLVSVIFKGIYLN